MPPAEEKWSFPFSIFLPRPEHMMNHKQWQKTNSVFLNMHKDKQPMYCIILRESFPTLCAMKHRWPIKQWELGKRWLEQFYIEIWDIVHTLKLQCHVCYIFLNQQALNIVLLSCTFYSDFFSWSHAVIFAIKLDCSQIISQVWRKDPLTLYALLSKWQQYFPVRQSSSISWVGLNMTSYRLLGLVFHAYFRFDHPCSILMSH